MRVEMAMLVLHFTSYDKVASL
eukprot:COSAG02_NODE_46938_length_345_cov_0.597561_2_plen_21_part_01